MKIPVPTAHKLHHMQSTKKRKKGEKPVKTSAAIKTTSVSPALLEEKECCRQLFVRQLLELHRMHCSLQVVRPVLGSPVERSTNVVGVFTGVVTFINVSVLLLIPLRESRLTRGTVVADSEVRRDVLTNVGKTARAVLSGTADLGSTLPDELGEVTPLFEVGHVRVGLAVEVGVVANFAVVEELGDDSRDVVSLNTSGNVLTVVTAIDIHAVGINASGSNLGGSRGELRVPLKGRSRVVGTVNVVVVNNALLVGGGLAGGSGDGVASL
jgi:hypothetical protein